MQLTIERATLNDANTLEAFERNVADPKIYGLPLGVQGAIKEICKNTFYFIKRGEILVATAAYRLRSDNSVFISNVAVDPTYRRQGIARTVMLFILEKCKENSRIDWLRIPRMKTPFSYTHHSGSRWKRAKRTIVAMANHVLCSL